jgi:hypothetical protein
MSRLVVKADPPNRSCPDRCQRGEVPTEGYGRNREGEGTETEILDCAVERYNCTQTPISSGFLEDELITI